MATTIVDLRASSNKAKEVRLRPWKQVTGIVLHQTAACLGERPGRWANVGAHVGVTRRGQVIWLHDFDRLVWHGNGLNLSTVGIECDGTYEGVQGDPKTFWRPADDPNRQPQQPTPELVEAARAAVKLVVEQVLLQGGRVRFLYAHRQSSGTRQSDPGSALWQQVAMPCHLAYGLSDGGPGFKVGTGRPIPEAWDPSRAGVRY